MKTALPLTFIALLFAGVIDLVRAEPPQPQNDFRKTLTAASKENKLGFILLGRPTCSICNHTRAMIREGKIDVSSADFVMADLNIDDSRTEAEFMRKYGREKWGDTLPFVVVTDSHGKALANSSGSKSAADWNTLLAAAKAKAKTSTPGGTGTGTTSSPSIFKSTPRP
jgi:hypothetical protein